MLVNRIHPFVCKVIFKKNHCVVFGDVVDETGNTLTNVFVCFMVFDATFNNISVIS